MEQVFPATKKPIAALRRKGLTEQSIFRDHEFGAEMESAGINMDPAVWTFKLRLRGGAMKALPVSGPEKKRLWSAVQDATGFVVFDSSEKRIALNLHHLLFCQFLFDAPFTETVVDEDEDKNCDLEVFLSESEEPLAFSVESDLSSLGAESGGDETQLQDLLFMAESSCDENDVLCFTDVDGETAFFRAADVAMISIPISAVEPDLFEAEDDDDPANSG